MADKKTKREKKKKIRKAEKEKLSKRMIRVKPGDVPYDVYLELKGPVKKINERFTNKGIEDACFDYFEKNDKVGLHARYSYIYGVCKEEVNNSVFEKYFPRKIIKVGIDLESMCFYFTTTVLQEVSLKVTCYKLPRQTFIEHNGQKYEIVFTSHALRRISERHAGAESDKGMFAVNLNCSMILTEDPFYEFKIIEAKNGQILARPSIDCGGYFSLIFEDGYAVAKTYLMEDWVEKRGDDWIVLSSKVNDGK